jgi:hypothetical protein
MKCQALTMADVVEALKRKQGEKPLREFAAEIGLHYTRLSAIYNGRQELRNNEVLARVGLKYEEHYRRL